MSWIPRDLEPALRLLNEALETLEPRSLRRTLSLLRHILTTRPSEINTRLNDAARDLPLPELLQAMTVVRDRMRSLDLDPAKVEQFEAGIETLARLSQALTDLVADHDRWQEAEQELRLGEDTWDGTVEGLEDSWTRIWETLEPVVSRSQEPWAASLNQEARQLAETLTARSPERSQRRFRSFRRLASTRFHRVDVMLKDQCDELRKVAGSLASVLRRMKS